MFICLEIVDFCDNKPKKRLAELIIIRSREVVQKFKFHLGEHEERKKLSLLFCTKFYT